MQQGPGHACAWGTATLRAPGEPKERTKKGQVWMHTYTCAHMCARTFGSQYEHTRVCMDLQLAVHAHVYAWTYSSQYLHTLVFMDLQLAGRAVVSIHCFPDFATQPVALISTTLPPNPPRARGDGEVCKTALCLCDAGGSETKALCGSWLRGRHSGDPAACRQPCCCWAPPPAGAGIPGCVRPLLVALGFPVA